MSPAPARRGAALLFVLVLALPALSATSCAYYNTFYLAKKYYAKATEGEPYPIEKPASQNQQDYARSVEYSKKVLSFHAKSKWVDDAYLLWARGLLGQDDPLQTVNMLEAFAGRFPQSPVRDEATFYLGVGYRHARKYRNAVRTLDEFLEKQPKHDLAPYAHLERARALMLLHEPAEAAASASRLIELFPKSTLLDRARIARADALFESRQFESARRDYREMGQRSETDEDRLKYLLREADCLEANQQYDAALGLLRDAIAHEREPLPPDTTGGRPAVVQQTPGYDRYGRLLVRIGTVHLKAGRMPDALEAYQRVVEDYPKDPLAGEAQFRIGYAYETQGDDFDRARQEYQAVRNQVGQAGFGVQAAERLYNLERIAQFRVAGGDSAEKQVETAFLLAEQYLFQIEKPERALDEYRKIAREHPGTAWAAKAMNAEAWVLSRRMNRAAEADSIFWLVVRNHPATEAQLAARDYLEMEGKQVPSELIKLPAPKVVAVRDTELTAPPDSVPPIGATRGDSLGRFGGRRPQLRPNLSPREEEAEDEEDEFGMRRVVPPDSLPPPPPSFLPDTTRRFAPPPDTTRRSAPPPDTTRRSGPPADTTRREPPVAPRDSMERPEK